jgi:hypothetical protein
MLKLTRKQLISIIAILTLLNLNCFLIHYDHLADLEILFKPFKETKTHQVSKLPLNNELDRILNKNKINDSFNIISISNYGYRDFTLNWIFSLKRINLTKFVVFCFDNQLFDYLIKNGYKENVLMVPTDWIDYKLTLKAANWSSKDYNHIVQSKVNVWYYLLKNDRNIIFSDPDVVFINENILTYSQFLFNYSRAHILISQDQEPGYPFYNTGFFFAKSTKFSKNLFLNLIQKQLRQKDRSASNNNEQYVLFKMLKQTNFNDSRILGLDPFLFANGRVFFELKLNDLLNVKPFTVHANYMIGVENKINSFKSKNLWFIS